LTDNPRNPDKASAAFRVMPLGPPDTMVYSGIRDDSTSSPQLPRTPENLGTPHFKPIERPRLHISAASISPAPDDSDGTARFYPRSCNFCTEMNVAPSTLWSVHKTLAHSRHSDDIVLQHTASDLSTLRLAQPSTDIPMRTPKTLTRSSTQDIFATVAGHPNSAV
jgi:hypothetical protein